MNADNPVALNTLLAACSDICGACAEECTKHDEMEHCHLCAEVCLRCALSCKTLADHTAGSLPSRTQSASA